MSGLGLEAQRTAVLKFLNGKDLAAEFTEIESGKRNDRPQLAEAMVTAKKIGATLIIANAFFTEAEMARRLNHERINLDRKRKLSVVDETEFRKTDVAARWLEGAERWQERVNRRKKAVAEYKRQKAARRKRRNCGADTSKVVSA